MPPKSKDTDDKLRRSMTNPSGVLLPEETHIGAAISLIYQNVNHPARASFKTQVHDVIRFGGDGP